MTQSVVTRSLGKRFGPKWAVAHVDLDLDAAQGLLLVGDNGSGKTTLLRLLAGLFRPTLGTVEVFGHPPHKPASPALGRMTLVAHQGYLYDALTPFETLLFWSRLRGAKPSGKELERLLEEAGLAADRDTPVRGFSAGMRKRLSILRLRIERPELVLLDEPFAALDAGGRAWLSGVLADLKGEGSALIVASHDPRRAAPLCDRAVRMSRGQLVWQGSPAEAVPGMPDRNHGRDDPQIPTGGQA